MSDGAPPGAEDVMSEFLDTVREIDENLRTIPAVYHTPVGEFNAFQEALKVRAPRADDRPPVPAARAARNCQPGTAVSLPLPTGCAFP